LSVGASGNAEKALPVGEGDKREETVVVPGLGGRWGLTTRKRAAGVASRKTDWRRWCQEEGRVKGGPKVFEGPKWVNDKERGGNRLLRGSSAISKQHMDLHRWRGERWSTFVS